MASLWRGGRCSSILLQLLQRGTADAAATSFSVATSLRSLVSSASCAAPASLHLLPQFTRSFAASSHLGSPLDGSPPDGRYVTLNDLRDNPGATKKARRVGRGIGSSKGKTSGRGHKGQKARSGGGPKPGFEGGQTPMRLRVPKRGFHNPFSRVYHPLNLDRLQEWIDAGRLDTSQTVTMKELRDSGVVRRRVGHGVKLLANGAERFTAAVHLQVSQASASAREAVRKAGGSVKTVYYNELGLRALLRPEWFEKKGRLLPRPARPPPKLVNLFDQVGELPPSRESYGG